MVGLAEEQPSVGLVGAYCLEGQQVRCAGLPYSTRVAGGREICRQHLLNRLYLFGSANSLLYRADLVRSREQFYNETNIHADTEACFALLKKCDFGFVHQVLTFTRPRPGSLNTISTDHQSCFAGMLHILLRHGKDCLTEEEFGPYLDRHLADYYRFLAKSVLLRRDLKFWEYHKRQLAELGFGFSRGRLALATLASCCSVALNPLAAVQKLVKRRTTRTASRASQRRGKTAGSLEAGKDSSIGAACGRE